MKRLSPRLTISLGVCVALLNSFGQISTSPSSGGTNGDGTFAGLDFTGSNLASVQTRSFSDLQNIPVSNLVYVDSVNGSDSTGLVHRADRPFLTCGAAKTAASSGDTIVVLPGTYMPSANLAKNGVNWFLYDGAIISATGNFDLFTDAGGTTTYNVGGRGKISLTGHGSCFIISNASSIIRVVASEVSQSSVADPLGAAEGGFYQTDGEFHIKADKISGMVSAAYWDKGVCFVEADVLTSPWSSGNAIYSQSAAANSHMHVLANEIRNQGGAFATVISIDGSSSAAFWITAHRILGHDVLIHRSGAKLYVNAQKLESTTTAPVDAGGMVDSQGAGFLYLTVQKVEALASSASTTSLFYLKDSDSYIDILQLVCPGITDGVTITDNGGTIATVGNHFLKVGRIDTQGNGIVFTSDTGSASFVSTNITSGAAKKDITQSGAGTLNVRSSSYDSTKITGTITNNDPGTATNDNASTGNKGEIQSSLVAVGSPQSLSNGTAANVTSISLTAGDWDVEGNVNFTETTSTVTARSAGISTTSATLPTDGSEAYCGVQSTVTSETNSIPLPRKRISIASTTTVYLVGKASFSAGTCGGFGQISGRRVR